MRNNKSSIDIVLQQLADEDDIVRENYIYILGEVGAEALLLKTNTLKTEKQLCDMNAICNEDYRRVVIDCLVTMHSTDDNPWLRGNIADALGKIGDIYAAPYLVNCLADKERIVRYSAAEALGVIGDASVVDFIVGVLEDEDWGVRLAAARALGAIGDSRVVDSLRSCLNDVRKDVRVGAEDALELLEVSPTAI